MDLTAEGPGWRLRLAEPADNPRLCELLREVHLAADLDLTQERDPDFFALHRMHGGVADTWVGEVQSDDGWRIEGCGSVVVRDGYVEGAVRPVGYLCDLRISHRGTRKRALPVVFGRVVGLARARHGVAAFHTVVFDDNVAARNALTRERKQRAGQPRYTPICPFDMAAIQLFRAPFGPAIDYLGRRFRLARGVREARVDDLPDIAALLDRDARARPFGVPMDADTLARRLATWPDFAITDFRVCEAHGRLVGCLAPWDTSSFKRTRVLGYHGAWADKRLWLDRGARSLRGTPLPEPGEAFRFSFLTHVAVEDDDPAVLRDLLSATLRDQAGLGRQFTALMVPRGSRLREALRGLIVQDTAMTIYDVAVGGAPAGPTLRPGFEIALS